MGPIHIVVFVVVSLLFLLIFSKSKSSELPNHITDEVVKYFAQKGEKIKAIQCYRQLHGSCLREAKAAIDRMVS